MALLLAYESKADPSLGFLRCHTNTSSKLFTLRLMRSVSSQNDVRMMTREDPGDTCSNACPDGNAGRAPFTTSDKGPNSLLTMVDSLGWVVSICNSKSFTPLDPVMVTSVVMSEVA